MQDKEERIRLEKNICSHKIFAVIFFLIPLIALGLIVWFNKSIILEYWILLLWSFASGLLGFSIYIFRKIPLLRRRIVTNESPWPSYVYYYPFALFAASILAVFILSFFVKDVSDVRFYLGAFAILVFLGLNIDLISILPLALFGFFKNKFKNIGL